MMSKVLIDKDEWYPVYSFTSYGIECELSDEDIVRIKAAEAEFDECQAIMRKACGDE
jgi:hypothetical protein